LDTTLGSSGRSHPEDAVEHAPIIDARHTARLVGQVKLDCAHSKSVRSYRLMPMLNQNSIAVERVLARSADLAMVQHAKLIIQTPERRLECGAKRSRSQSKYPAFTGSIELPSQLLHV
jgi:hypothetical protein